MFSIDSEYLAIYISIISLLIAILSWPISYWASLKTMREKFDESERRKTKQAIKQVVENINEFFLIFYSAVENIVKIDRLTVTTNPGLIDPFLQEIDLFIKKTGIHRRLEFSINNLFQTETGENTFNDVTKYQLLSIRNQIQVACYEDRIMFVNIIACCKGDKLTDSLNIILLKDHF